MYLSAQILYNNTKIICFCPLFFFFYSPNNSPYKFMKNASYFIWRAFFYSQDIRIFIFPSFPLVIHCLKKWSKKNLKVHDVINCLNKNLKTYCLITWEGKKVWYLNLLNSWSIKLGTFLWKKIYRKCASNTCPIALYNFGQLPKSANACKNLFWK